MNWVKALSDCSLGKIFKDLQIGASNDVDEANKLATDAHSNIHFAVHAGGNHFSVTRNAQSGIDSVDFSLAKTEISVKGSSFSFALIPSLNTDGACRLRLKGNGLSGDEMELWQIRRLVLERLFFS